ncbi:hypothetical protein ACTIVE_0709 [Actinomadura verrucosospora]|uniref:Uncharacterized protein n=1 Tax=Actinomadura verrucosospora TaxID=46165 RepID=A0A7D3VPM5_ACTVE|nr:hypothetical protein ACTIVE_0709 [Actinomadura verrucosospora]
MAVRADLRSRRQRAEPDTRLRPAIVGRMAGHLRGRHGVDLGCELRRPARNVRRAAGGDSPRRRLAGSRPITHDGGATSDQALPHAGWPTVRRTGHRARWRAGGDGPRRNVAGNRLSRPAVHDRAARARRAVPNARWPASRHLPLASRYNGAGRNGTGRRLGGHRGRRAATDT